MAGALPSLKRLVGASPEEAVARLGPPEVDCPMGRERWLVYRAAGVRIRIRCGARSVCSWSATFDPGWETLREAAEAVGVWPECAPDVRAAGEDRLILRALRDPERGTVHSLTATVRGGRIRGLVAFDEEPEWRGGIPCG